MSSMRPIQFVVSIMTYCLAVGYAQASSEVGLRLLSSDQNHTLVCRGDVSISLSQQDKALGLVSSSGVQFRHVEGGKVEMSSSLPKQSVQLIGSPFKGRLKHIELDDSCTLKSVGWSQKDPLTLDSRSSGSVVLDGYINLVELNQRGEGTIQVVWLNTQELNVEASAGKLMLAGVAHQLRLKARGESQVDIAQLRGKSLWLWVSGKASVFGSSIKNFLAYATSQGKVAVRGRPMFSQVFLGDSAAVVRSW